MYINHINKYDDAQAIQDALDAGTLANPYVAMTSAGTIDYNSLEPTPEPSCYIGEWSEVEEGVYNFQITDTDPSLWETQVKIGVLLGVHSDGNHEDLDVMLNYDQGTDAWHMVFYSENASDTPEYNFTEGPDTWDTGVYVDEVELEDCITVDWDGIDTFMFQSLTGYSTPLNMTTINPECPEELDDLEASTPEMP